MEEVKSKFTINDSTMPTALNIYLESLRQSTLDPESTLSCDTDQSFFPPIATAFWPLVFVSLGVDLKSK